MQIIFGILIGLAAGYFIFAPSNGVFDNAHKKVNGACAGRFTCVNLDTEACMRAHKRYRDKWYIWCKYYKGRREFACHGMNPVN